MGTVTLYPDYYAKRYNSSTTNNDYENGWYSPYRVGEGGLERAPWQNISDVDKEIYTTIARHDFMLAFRFPAAQLQGKRLTKTSLSLQYEMPGNVLIGEEHVSLGLQIDTYINDNPINHTFDDVIDAADRDFHEDWPPSSFTVENSYTTDSQFNSSYIYVTLRGWIDRASTELGSFTCVSATFTYQDAQPPSVYSITTEISQPSGLPSKFSGYGIAGVSKCQVTAVVTADADRAISSVYFRYTDYAGTTRTVSMSKSGSRYVGTTPTAVAAGSTVFTVTAVDSAGESGSGNGTLSGVYAYSGPIVSVTGLQRVNSSSVETDTGQYYRIKVSESHSSINGQNTVRITTGVKGSSTRQTISAGSWTRSNSAVLTNEDLVYVITVIITDDVGNSQTVEASVNGRLRDFVMKRNVSAKSSHFAVGMTPDENQGSGVSSIQLPPGGKIIIGGQDITAWLRSQIGGNW